MSVVQQVHPNDSPQRAMSDPLGALAWPPGAVLASRRAAVRSPWKTDLDKSCE